MNRSKDPQVTIHIEEEHDYNVDLGVVSYVAWQKAKGSIKVEIPYDGTLLKQNGHESHQYQIGSLHIGNTQTGEKESLPITIETTIDWPNKLKSNKKSITTALYDIVEPGDPLVSIDGVVLDDVLQENVTANLDGIFGNINAYNNPLALQLLLWVPDLLAETRPSELYELETMLLRGENTRQVFMPNLSSMNFERRLTENLIALANTAGGVILLGADKNGYVTGMPTDINTKRFTLTKLLQSALQSSPAVPIWRVSEIQHASGKMVVRIEIPTSGSTVHQLEGQLFKRQGKSNTSEALSTTFTPQSALPPLPESSLQDVFDRDEAGVISFRSGEDVIVCNGGNGLKELRLGAYLCGLINAGKRIGRIIISDLPIAQTNHFNAWSGVNEDLEKILSQEMEKVLPHLETPIIERRQIGSQKIAIIHLSAWQLPIALYNGEAYVWQNITLNELKIEDLFDKYLSLSGSRGQSFDDQDVYLERAILESPIRPPEHLDKTTSIEVKERLLYDVEYQAQVWEPRPFKRDTDTVGFSLQLTAPLRHISLSLRDDSGVTTANPEATGQIRIRLKDVLISGLEIKTEAHNNNQWLETVPIHKCTYLNLHYNAHLNELFQRRTKTSVLRFLIHDVLLDRERIEDLAQVCADIGFRVYDKELFDTSPSAPARATIQALRSSGYYDIALLIGLMCQRAELTRELHYDGWRDSKSTYTSLLDVRVKLWGTGHQVEKEIGRLQMELYQTISQRLQHLRAE